jgi:hypothetical protein
MSDYIVRRLVHERHADYLRETEHAELVAEAHATRAEEVRDPLDRATTPVVRRGWLERVRAARPGSFIRQAPRP